MESYAKLITVWADIIPERCAELILRYNIPPEQFLYDTLLPCIIEYYLELFTFRNRPICQLLGVRQTTKSRNTQRKEAAHAASYTHNYRNYK